MSSPEYRLIEGTVLPREAGPVIDAGGITMFREYPLDTSDRESVA